MVLYTQPTDGRDRVLHALTDPTRRDIVRATALHGASISTLAQRYPMSFAAVQKHVAILERAGLVAKERRGREALVRARLEPIREARLLLEQLEAVWHARLTQFGEVLADTTESEAR